MQIHTGNIAHRQTFACIHTPAIHTCTHTYTQIHAHVNVSTHSCINITLVDVWLSETDNFQTHFRWLGSNANLNILLHYYIYIVRKSNVD